eukprot:6208148-Pleurochrysis_carterae.AAC.1
MDRSTRRAARPHVPERPRLHAATRQHRPCRRGHSESCREEQEKSDAEEIKRTSRQACAHADAHAHARTRGRKRTGQEARSKGEYSQGTSWEDVKAGSLPLRREGGDTEGRRSRRRRCRTEEKGEGMRACIDHRAHFCVGLICS